MQYLYSSFIGTFVFDKDFHILFEAPFPKDKQVEYSLMLMNFEWIEPEDRLLKQYGKLTIIGKKTDKKQQEFSTDLNTLEGVSKALASRSFDLQKANVLIAKQLVKRSFSSDDLVIQSVRGAKEMDKAINLLVKRLREWYELYNPEISRKITDNEAFVELILEKEKDALLTELGMTEDESMGANFPQRDLEAMMQLAKEAFDLINQRVRTKTYLEDVMNALYPNISKLATPFIAAELLSSAGSLRKMAMMPSSTIQLLGAEKALFKHLKNRSIKPPKHGFIVNHPFMSRVKNKGKLARILADKISIASRTDYFKGEFIGDKLLAHVESVMR